MKTLALVATLALATACGAAYAADTSADIRARAIEKCKANRGVDCTTEAGLKEWIEAEKTRPAGQRSPMLQQKWEAERRKAAQPK